MPTRTLDEALDEVDKKEKEVIPDDIIDKLKELGFEEKEDKHDLWFKDIGDDKYFYWDFRKTMKGTAYVAMSDGFMDEKEVKAMNEYTYIRQEIKEPVKTTKKETVKKEKPSAKPKPIPEEKAITLRGTENDVMALMNSIRLDSIIEVAKDGLGEGVLYHNLGEKLGMEPSAELIDMVMADMGNIDVEIVDVGMHRLINEDTGDSYLTYYATVKAIDKTTGTTGLGAAEQVIDFDEMKNNSRSFARTLAIRKACRNSCERLIPVPRKALVALIQRMLKEHKSRSK